MKIDPASLVPVQRRIPSVQPSPLVARQRQPGFEAGKTFFILEDAEGVAQSLANRLASMGIKTRVVDTADAIDHDADGVIFTAPIRDYETVDVAIEMNRFGFECAKRVAQTFAERGGVFVTVQDTGGKFSFDEWCEPNKAPLGGLAALAKTAAREWPLATVRAIDLDAGHREVMGVATELFEELVYGEGLEVGLPEGERFVVALDDIQLDESTMDVSRIGAGDVILVSGGARGVTAECVIALAQETQARFALLGRSELVDEPDYISTAASDSEIKRALLEEAKRTGASITPRSLSRDAKKILKSREIRNTIRRVEATGAIVSYYTVDITDAAQLYEATAHIRKTLGPITTLVHGAGVLADKKIQDKTQEEFDLVFNTKVAGFYALSIATNADNIHTVALFSSVAGRFGNVGQCDYAMANEVLNKVAHIESRNRVDCLVKSFAWGPWDGGMVDASLRAHFESQGVKLIGLRAGARQFVRELLEHHDGAAVEVVLGDGFAFENESQDSSVDYLVSKDLFPFLVDHTIKGVPVVPMVMALDWIRDAALTSLDAGQIELLDIKVVRGMRLDGFEDGVPHTFTVKTTRDEELCNVSIEDASGAVYYRAIAALWNPGDGRKAARPDRPIWNGEVYDGHVLFHGPEFHFLKNIDEPSGTDWWVDVQNRSSRDWSDAYQIDLPALDAALQLSVLWSSAQTNGLVAPMSCDHFTVRTHLNPTYAHLRARKVSDASATADLHVYAEDGTEVAAMLGVTCVRYEKLP